MLALIFIIWLLLCLPVKAATVAASSGSWADVSNAVFSASAGDTVTIPTGSNYWDGATLLVTKSLSIIGAGTNATILSNLGSGVTNSSFMYLYGPVFRVSGIQFEMTTNLVGNVPTLIAIGTNSVNYSSGNFISGFRIDHCYFKGGRMACEIAGNCNGVIDQNTFYAPAGAVRVSGDNDESWLRTATPGTTNCVVIENNLILQECNPNGQECFYHQYGARTTIRYNSYYGTNTAYQSAGFMDTHGNWGNDFGNPNPDQFRGQPLIEVYMNLISMHDANWVIDQRGGSILVWSNTFTKEPSGYGPATMIFMKFEDASFWSNQVGSPFFNTNNYTDVATATRTNYPSHDQVQSTFSWSNTFNGVFGAPSFTVSGNDGEWYHDTVVLYQRLNRDYFTNAPGATNIYYPYVPLTYPHPLVTAQDGDGRRRLNIGHLRAGKVMGP